METNKVQELSAKLGAVNEVSRDRQIEEENKILFELEEQLVSSYEPSHESNTAYKYAHQNNAAVHLLAQNPTIINIANAIPKGMQTSSWNFIHIVSIKSTENGVSSENLGDIASAVNYLLSLN